MASEVLIELKASDDPLDRALARTLEAWQSARREAGKPAYLGYEPRDVRKIGAAKLIAQRVLSAARGFEEVGEEDSYEQLVLDYPNYPEFKADVVQAAKFRLGLIDTGAPSFKEQPVQFLLKSTVLAMFGQDALEWSNWPKRKIILPDLHADYSSLEGYRRDGFVAFIWIHEDPREGPKGKGLTGLIEVGPVDEDGRAFVLNSLEFKHAMRMDEIRSKFPENEFIDKLHRSRGDRCWPVGQADADALLLEIAQKAALIASRHSSPIDTAHLIKKPKKGEERLQKIASRPNQAALRKTLLKARGTVCAITGPSVKNVLDAAHIIPFSIDNPERDAPENMLLLRADVHRLFDKFLISIEPLSKTIVVAQKLMGSIYNEYSGQEITDNVDTASLEDHFEKFTEKQNP